MPTTQNEQRNAMEPLIPTPDRFEKRLEGSVAENAVDFNREAETLIDSGDLSPTTGGMADPLSQADAYGSGNRADVRGSTKQDPNNVSIDDSNAPDFGGPFLDPLRADPTPEGRDESV